MNNKNNICESCLDEFIDWHNKNNICESCEDEIIDCNDPSYVFEDTNDFIKEQDHWEIFSMPTICWGMIMSVIMFIFEVAPNKKRAKQLILDALEACNTDKDKANA